MSGTVVYIPGFASGESAEVVREFFDQLRQSGFEAHYVPLSRLRAYTSSADSLYPAPLWNMAQGVRDYMNERGITGAHLIGHSMGGAVATIVAMEWPELVSRVAVVCPASVYPTRLLTLLWRATVKGLRDQWYLYWPRHSFRSSARAFAIGARRYVGWRPWELRRCVQEARGLISTTTLRLGNILSSTGIPVWLLYGGRDLLFNPKLTEATLRESSMQVVHIPDGVHDLPYHQGELLFTYLRDSNFLAHPPERS